MFGRTHYNSVITYRASLPTINWQSVRRFPLWASASSGPPQDDDNSLPELLARSGAPASGRA